jgi:hypothetical protein
MGVGSGSGSIIELLAAAVDANVLNTVTASIALDDARNVALYTVAASGTHATHVTTLQISPNGTDWFDTAHTVPGLGFFHDTVCVGTEVRAKITTAEGAVSTIDIYIVGK